MKTEFPSLNVFQKTMTPAPTSKSNFEIEKYLSCLSKADLTENNCKMERLFPKSSFYQEKSPILKLGEPQKNHEDIRELMTKKVFFI